MYVTFYPAGYNNGPLTTQNKQKKRRRRGSTRLLVMLPVSWRRGVTNIEIPAPSQVVGGDFSIV